MVTIAMKNLICGFLLLASFNPASADQLLLATSGNFLPFTGEELKNRGMMVEIVERVMETAELEREIVFQPTWSNLLADTEAGRYQATFPWYYNEERAQRFYYTDSLVSNYIMPFVLSGGEVQASSPEELAGYRLCRPQGYFLHDMTELLQQPGTTLHQPETLNDCFELLKAGAVDVVPADIFSSMGAIHTVFDDPDTVRRLSFVFSRQNMHILVPKKAEGAEQIVNRINAAIIKLELRGALQHIRDVHAYRFLRQYQ